MSDSAATEREELRDEIDRLKYEKADLQRDLSVALAAIEAAKGAEPVAWTANHDADADVLYVSKPVAADFGHDDGNGVIFRFKEGGIIGITILDASTLADRLASPVQGAPPPSEEDDLVAAREAAVTYFANVGDFRQAYKLRESDREDNPFFQVALIALRNERQAAAQRESWARGEAGIGDDAAEAAARQANRAKGAA